MSNHETAFFQVLADLRARAARQLETRLRMNTHRYSDMLQLAPPHFSTFRQAGTLALCHAQSSRELAA
jgi:hypothetical protein